MSEKLKDCKWKPFDGDNYDTSCGNTFTFTDGTPEENDFRFCPYCGMPLVTVKEEIMEELSNE